MKDILNESIHDRFIFKSIFLIGPPGSGKNYVSEQLGLENLGLKQVDVDQTIGRLKAIKHQEIPYEQGYKLTGQRLEIWKQNFLGLIVNSTGRNSNQVMELKSQLENVGYDTFLLFVEVDKETALRRITSRPTSSTSIGDRGRTVDMDYFEKTYETTMTNLEKYKEIFGKNYAIVTNNNELVESRQLLKITMREAQKKLRTFLLTPAASAPPLRHHRRHSNF